MIRFLETWLGVPEPNISAWRRAVCGDLTSAFDFETATYSMPALPKTSAQAGAQKCAHAPAEPPREGSMPVQEIGTRPRRPLPYRPDATIARDGGSLLVRLSNAAEATSSAHFAVYANDDSAPRQYDVAPGESIKDTFASSDVAIHGSAGFVRRFGATAMSAALMSAPLMREDARADSPSDRDESANKNAGAKPAFSRSMA